MKRSLEIMITSNVYAFLLFAGFVFIKLFNHSNTDSNIVTTFVIYGASIGLLAACTISFLILKKEKVSTLNKKN